MYRPGIPFGEDELVRQFLQVAVEQDADDFSFGVYGRASGITAMGIGGRDEVKRNL